MNKIMKQIFTRNNLSLIALIALIVGIVVVYKMKVEKYTERKVNVTYYYMPKCPYCVKFSDEWNNFQATADPSLIKATSIDATTTEGSKQASDADVNGFPTIILKPSGKSPIVYKGERTATALNDAIANLN
jgi:hypothetical protein